MMLERGALASESSNISKELGPELENSGAVAPTTVICDSSKTIASSISQRSPPLLPQHTHVNQPQSPCTAACSPQSLRF